MSATGMSDRSTLQMRLPQIRVAASDLAPDVPTLGFASERTLFARELHWRIDKLPQFELRPKAGQSSAGRSRLPV